MEKRALVIGASGGVGQALVTELKSRNYRVTCISRQNDGLDITNEKDVSQKLGRLDTGFDLVIVATGVLSGSGGPEKSISALSANDMAMVFAINAIGPAPTQLPPLGVICWPSKSVPFGPAVGLETFCRGLTSVLLA